MITEITVWLKGYSVPVIFVCHLITFIGIFYVVLHNRKMPQWHITPLWYLGLANLFVVTSILIQWTIGVEHPLSYWNLGILGETLIEIILASFVLIMFSETVWADLKGRRQRRNYIKE